MKIPTVLTIPDITIKKLRNVNIQDMWTFEIRTDCTVGTEFSDTESH